MQFNQFSILFAAIFSLVPGFMYSAIICIERYEKPGCAPIDLFYDYHGKKAPEQEAIITELLTAQQKCHVFVEDMTDYVGSAQLKEKLDCLWCPGQLGSMLGLVSRLQNNGISSSSVEPRSGVGNRLNDKNNISPQEIIADYKKTRDSVKGNNPIDAVDRVCYEIIASIERQEDSDLQNYPFAGSLDSGGQLLEMIALKRLCTQDEKEYKVLIAGFIHCSNIGLVLEYLGYSRTQCLEDEQKNTKIITEIYEQFLSDSSKSSYIVIDSVSAYHPRPKSCTKTPLSIEQIKDYFNNSAFHKSYWFQPSWFQYFDFCPSSPFL